jgi:hypothetical protein
MKLALFFSPLMVLSLISATFAAVPISNNFPIVIGDLQLGGQFTAPSEKQAKTPTDQVASTLRPLVPRIRAELPKGMVMRLPMAIEGVAYDGRKFPIYGKILPREDDQFTIQLAATPDCDVRACLVGYMAVAPLGSQSLPTNGETTESINITSTIRGKYLYRRFGASSPPASIIVWEQGGFAYVVSSGMNKQKVLEIAKSMANGVAISSSK